MRTTFSLLLISLVAVGCAARIDCPPPVASDNDPLWRIVDHCFDANVPDYCAVCPAPLVTSPCAASKPCPEITQAWAETAEFVAMRDVKMCGCPKEFVHGLAIPRARVTGIEDPQHPDGIWQFAWNVAQQHIDAREEIALIVNAQRLRTLNQLHVHLVRLRGGARAAFTAANSVHVDDLAEVWRAAAKKAGVCSDYSILVAAADGAGYLVVVDRQHSLEYDAAVATCPQSPATLSER